MKYVLDASVALKFLLEEEHSDKAIQLIESFQDGMVELIAPDSLLVEVGHALTRAERRGIIRRGESSRLFADFLGSVPQVFPFSDLLLRAITISSDTRTGVYDCLYVALAEREECELITADRRLVTTMAGQFDRIVVLGET